MKAFPTWPRIWFPGFRLLIQGCCALLLAVCTGASASSEKRPAPPRPTVMAVSLQTENPPAHSLPIQVTAEPGGNKAGGMIVQSATPIGQSSVSATADLPLARPQTATLDKPTAAKPGRASATAPAPASRPSTPPEPTPTLGITRKIPILMYHHVSTPPPSADRYRIDLSISPALFESHLKYLKDSGYQTVSLYDVVNALGEGNESQGALPPKPIVLTFDDGYLDNYTNAFPLLKTYGMKAIFFVITDFANENRADYATWDEWREMATAGMEIESHTRNHPNLAGKSTDYLVWEALGSTEAIQKQIGRRPRFIAYPSGSYDQHTIDVFRSADYLGGVTTHQGDIQAAGRLFEMHRLRIHGDTDLRKLQELLIYVWPKG